MRIVDLELIFEQMSAELRHSLQVAEEIGATELAASIRDTLDKAWAVQHPGILRPGSGPLSPLLLA